MKPLNTRPSFNYLYNLMPWGYGLRISESTSRDRSAYGLLRSFSDPDGLARLTGNLREQAYETMQRRVNETITT